MCCYVRSSSRRKAGMSALKAVYLRRNAHVLCVHSTKCGYTYAFTDGEQNKRSGDGSNEVA